MRRTEYRVPDPWRLFARRNGETYGLGIRLSTRIWATRLAIAAGRGYQDSNGRKKFFPRRQPQVANIGLTKRAFVALSGAWTGAKTPPTGSASAKMPRILGRKPAFCPCVMQSDARR